MIVYRTNSGTAIIQTAQHGIFYIDSVIAAGIYGTNRGIVKVANA